MSLALPVMTILVLTMMIEICVGYNDVDHWYSYSLLYSLFYYVFYLFKISFVYYFSLLICVSDYSSVPCLFVYLFIKFSFIIISCYFY